VVVVFGPQGIPGDVKSPILVAELGRRGRLQRIGFNGFYCRHVPVEQEYMPVELPCAALCARCAAEFDLTDYSGKTFHGELIEAVALLRQGSNTERNGG
jgi:hypothetical protein